MGLVGDQDEAAPLAERLRTAVAGSRTADGHAVTASVGIALTRPGDGEDAADALWRLVDRADAAMYEAKQQGRDRVASMWVPRPVLRGGRPRPAARPARRLAGRRGAPVADREPGGREVLFLLPLAP